VSGRIRGNSLARYIWKQRGIRALDSLAVVVALGRSPTGVRGRVRRWVGGYAAAVDARFSIALDTVFELHRATVTPWLMRYNACGARAGVRPD